MSGSSRCCPRCTEELEKVWVECYGREDESWRGEMDLEPELIYKCWLCSEVFFPEEVDISYPTLVASEQPSSKWWQGSLAPAC